MNFILKIIIIKLFYFLKFPYAFALHFAPIKSALHPLGWAIQLLEWLFLYLNRIFGRNLPHKPYKHLNKY